MRLDGALSARSTTLTSSRRSNGFGRYSNAPRSVALTAVSSVLLRAHDDDAQIRAQLLDARDQIETVLVRHDHVGDDEIALAVGDPPPQGRRVAGHPDIMAEPGQRLVQHHADRAVVVGHQNRRAHHPPPSCTLPAAITPDGATIGRNTRNTVRRGWLSNSIDAAVVADHLGDQCKTQASSVALGRDKRIEQMRLEIVGDAGAVIGDRDHQRQVPARLAARPGEAQTVPIGGGRARSRRRPPGRLRRRS